MTDLPEDDGSKQLKNLAFAKLMALKYESQAKKREELANWQLRYQSLDDEERAKIDEELGRRCDEIAAQFGKSHRFRKR